ncbi:hypothetical protein OG528_01730 [Streptomyces platensis]|uniref:hypothetical protein n=1 Tax=Streptomyces platensis TaxID=58346 RepID=UPI0030E32ACC
MEEFTQRHRGRLEAMPLRRARGPGLLAGGERVLLRILEFAEEARPGRRGGPWSSSRLCTRRRARPFPGKRCTGRRSRVELVAARRDGSLAALDPVPDVPPGGAAGSGADSGSAGG